MNKRQITWAQTHIGDSKLPNHYWISVSNDYYYYNNEAEAFDWISDHKLFNTKSELIAVFDTYHEAREYINENLYLGMKYDDNFTINSIFIEDRLSGEVFSHIRHYLPEEGVINDDYENDDYKFTEETMTKRGAKFS
jgi:hypothetical protein